MKRLAFVLLAACTPSSTIGYVERDDGVIDGVADGAVEDARASVDLGGCELGAMASETVAALRGEATEGGRWLYPYDEAVMPRGVGAPLMMWDGLDAEAVRIEVRGKRFRFETCVVPQAPHRTQITDDAWERVERASEGRDDPLSLRVSMLASGATRVLPERTITIASEALRGSLYYMAYGSRLAPATASGAVFRMQLGQRAEPAVAPLSCAGCHAVSAEGNRMVAYTQGLGAVFASTGALTSLPSGAPNAELVALTPDGSLYVSPARATGLGPRFYGPGLGQSAALFETDTGSPVTDHNLAPGMLMPAFAPEGDALVFADAALAGKGLALMRFDRAARRADGYRTLLVDEVRYPGWPTFVPGQGGVVFAFGTRNDYSGNGALLLPGKTVAPASDLFALPLEEGATPRMLYRAMGYASASDADAERSELPFPEQELHRSYNPQVAPVRAGGFHWLFFDSVRHYGELGLKRQIWCAALDEADPTRSHPAFYVRGQDLDASTFRPIFTR